MKHKVLSVKQPWAFLICSGIKDIENRTWKCPQKYIGERVLIHAASKSLDWDKLINYMINMGTFDEFTAKWPSKWLSNLQTGSIIGSVEIVDCVINHPSVWAEKTEVINDSEFTFLPAYGKKIYNWVLANPVLFDNPILNVKGKLGFWDYDLPEEYETILKL